MFDGEHVASRIIEPRFPFADGFSSLLSACSGVGLAFLTTTSLTSFMKSMPKRLRSSDRTSCPNGHLAWQLSCPMKYWQYGLRATSFTRLGSLSFALCCIIWSPSAILAFTTTGRPRLDGGNAIYLSSTAAQSMLLATTIHSSWTLNFMSQYWLKSSKVIWTDFPPCTYTCSCHVRSFRASPLILFAFYIAYLGAEIKCILAVFAFYGQTLFSELAFYLFPLPSYHTQKT